MTVTNPLNIVVLISGNGSNLKSLVEHSRSHQVPVCFALIVCDSPDAPGLVFARSSGIPTSVVERIPGQSRDEFCKALLAAVSTAKPDLVVLAGFMRVLSREFIAAFRDKIVNIHPSLLPSFRGLKAQAQALSAGVRIAGCTVHLVDEEVDAGPILAQAAVTVLPNDSVETLSARILAAEHKLLPAVIAAIAYGKLKISRIGGEVSLEFAPGLVPTSSPQLVSLEG